MIYPGLADSMIPMAQRAERLGLYLAHYNSGVPSNPKNGFRIFAGTEERDYFGGGMFLAQVGNKKRLVEWLDDFEAKGSDPQQAIEDRQDQILDDATHATAGVFEEAGLAPLTTDELHRVNDLLTELLASRNPV